MALRHDPVHTGPAAGSPEIPLDKPLTGVRVVEFSHFIAAPSAGQALVDLGAEVVKVEPPRGDPARPSAGNNRATMFYAFNRGKRSIVLDLRDPEDEATAQTLARGADIVVHNVSPRSMRRHGLDAASVRGANPRVVYASVSGFPSNTARGGAKAFDGIGQAETGMLAVNGSPGTGPTKLPFAPVDNATASTLVQAILAAYVRRLRTGEGGEVEVSLFEAGVAAQQSYWASFLQRGSVPERIGNLEPDVAPAAEILDVADGTVILSAYLADHFRALAGLLDITWVLDDPRFATLDRRVENQVVLHDVIQGALTERGWSVAEAGEAFESIGIAHGIVGSYADIEAGDVLRPSGMVREARREDGTTYDAFHLPYRFGGVERDPRSPAVPALGADGATIRAEIAAGRWDAPGTQPTEPAHAREYEEVRR